MVIQGFANTQGDHDLLPAIAVGDSPEILDAITDPQVSAVVWMREPPGPCEEFPAYAAPKADEMGCLPDWLQADINSLRARIERWSPGGALGVQLETVRSRSCPAFHQDTLHARLLVSYKGPGVEFGGSRGGLPFFHTPRGAVALFKGRLWPTSGAPVLHRSPPASQNRPRWLLTMDLFGADPAR